MPASDVIGAPLPPQRVVVERGPLSNFATAVGDDDPNYHDPRAAQEAGFDAIPAPPTYAFAMQHWGAFPEIQPDGAGGVNPMMHAIGALMEGGGLVLHGEQGFTYHRPIVVGDVLTAEGSITDVYEKHGSGGGTMTFVVAETVWRDGSGAPVVTTTTTLLHRA